LRACGKHLDTEEEFSSRQEFGAVAPKMKASSTAELTEDRSSTSYSFEGPSESIARTGEESVILQEREWVPHVRPLTEFLVPRKERNIPKIEVLRTCRKHLGTEGELSPIIDDCAAIVPKMNASNTSELTVEEDVSSTLDSCEEPQLEKLEQNTISCKFSEMDGERDSQSIQTSGVHTSSQEIATLIELDDSVRAENLEVPSSKNVKLI